MANCKMCSGLKVPRCVQLLILAVAFLSPGSGYAEQGKGIVSDNLLLMLFLLMLASLAMVSAFGLFMYFILNRISNKPRRTAWGTVICANLGFIVGLIIVIALQTSNNLIIFPVLISAVLAGGRLGHHFSSPFEL